MSEAAYRLLFVMVWLAIILLMLWLARWEPATRPYIAGLLFTPFVNAIFYVASYLWFTERLSTPYGFFSHLSVYRSWAGAINFLLVLIVAITVSWMKRRRL